MLKDVIKNKYVQLVMIIALIPILFYLISYYVAFIKYIGIIIGSYLSTL